MVNHGGGEEGEVNDKIECYKVTGIYYALRLRGVLGMMLQKQATLAHRCGVEADT